MTKLMNMEILENISIAKDVYRMKLYSEELDFEKIMAGSFLNIKVGSGSALLLRRPISIFETDEMKRTISIIYKVLGKGTDLMRLMKPGELINVLGPLGTGFPIQDEGGRVLLVGGGVGVPPLYELGKRLREKGIQVETVLGFRDRESIFCEEDFLKLGPLHIATEDGSSGTKGYVTDAISEKDISFDTIYACGPKPMLRALDETYRETKKGFLSFEERMACGIGACYGCMTETREGLKRVCKDGPVFKLGEIRYE